MQAAENAAPGSRRRLPRTAEPAAAAGSSLQPAVASPAVAAVLLVLQLAEIEIAVAVAVAVAVDDDGRSSCVAVAGSRPLVVGIVACLLLSQLGSRIH